MEHCLGALQHHLPPKGLLTVTSLQLVLHPDLTDKPTALSDMISALPAQIPRLQNLFIGFKHLKGCQYWDSADGTHSDCVVENAVLAPLDGVVRHFGLQLEATEVDLPAQEFHHHFVKALKRRGSLFSFPCGQDAMVSALEWLWPLQLGLERPTEVKDHEGVGVWRSVPCIEDTRRTQGYWVSPAKRWQKSLYVKQLQLYYFSVKVLRVGTDAWELAFGSRSGSVWDHTNVDRCLDLECHQL